MAETQEMWVWSLSQEDPMEKEMATHSSILSWEIPWTEEPGGLQSTGSQRVGHNWVHAHTHTHTHTHKLSYIPFIKVKGTLVIQLRPTLCNPLDYTSVYGILQAKILELVSIFFSRGSSQPRDSTQVSCIAYKFFTVWTTIEDPFFKWWSIILLLLNMSGFRDLLLSSRMWRE